MIELPRRRKPRLKRRKRSKKIAKQKLYARHSCKFLSLHCVLCVNILLRFVLSILLDGWMRAWRTASMKAVIVFATCTYVKSNYPVVSTTRLSAMFNVFSFVQIVRRVTKRFGMKEVGEDEDWALFWTDCSVALERCMDMKRYQVRQKEIKQPSEITVCPLFSYSSRR